MEEVTEFKKLNFDMTDTLLIESEYLMVDENTDTRIYYIQIEEGKRFGFRFYVTEFFSSCVDNEKTKDVYDSEGFQAACMFQGIAYHDGLRHLYMGDKRTDTENYLYYADTIVLSKIFLKLRELEMRYCSVDQLNN